jgi:hypothetical protein
MDQHELDNWKKVKASLESAGKTDCMFYKRAVSIVNGKKDLLESEWLGVELHTDLGDQV